MKEWMKYAGLGTQFFVSIGLTLALGWKLDQWLNLTTPIFIWVLPFLIIVYILIKLIVETNKKK